MLTKTTFRAALSAASLALAFPVADPDGSALAQTTDTQTTDTRATNGQAIGQAGGGDATACGATLSEPVMNVWRDLDGATGRLGCPTSREQPSSTSSHGSASRVAVFGLNGEIVLHASGDRAGQAFAVSGCFYRLYSQFGGPSGWLGLPVAEAENTPDGSRQDFEGGSMRYARAIDECEATPAAPTTPAPAASDQALVPLDVYEDPSTGDRLSLTAKASIEEALAAGYRRLATQARILSGPAPGATELKMFLNDDRHLREVLASAQSERDALDRGFAFDAGQGFVWTDPRPGAVRLDLYLDPTSGRARLTAGPADEADATARGYRFVRVEGYAAPPP
jgi:hypothetical protein